MESQTSKDETEVEDEVDDLLEQMEHLDVFDCINLPSIPSIPSIGSDTTLTAIEEECPYSVCGQVRPK